MAPKPRSVLVTGSREFTDKQTIFYALDHARPDIVIHGGARGADTIASEWCSQNPKVQEICVPAKWHIHGKAAGPYRNMVMIALKPDRVLAFIKATAENKGTLGMIDLAKGAGTQVDVWVGK
jgi:hypothetical protein